MVDNPTPGDIDLETFLKAAGQSFTDAQRALVPSLDVSVNMMLSSADLELKVAVSSDLQGKMSIRPISSEDLSRGDIDPGLLSTIRVGFVSSIGEVKPQPAPTTDSTARGHTVPSLEGLTLHQAVALLKAGGWQFAKHAASTEEIASAGEGNSGRILNQQPPAGQVADIKKTVVHFWVDLGSYSVKEIDGIGVRIGESLSKIGISTVGELSVADVSRIASALNIGENRVQDFVDMAGLMSSLAVIGCKDRVELLVKGAGIRSVEQLAGADPAELFRTCQEAIASGKVRVPRGFSCTADDVKEWIKAAGDYQNK